MGYGAGTLGWGWEMGPGHWNRARTWGQDTGMGWEMGLGHKARMGLGWDKDGTRMGHGARTLEQSWDMVPGHWNRAGRKHQDGMKMGLRARTLEQGWDMGTGHWDRTGLGHGARTPGQG